MTEDWAVMENIARSFFVNLFTSKSKEIEMSHILSGVERCITE